MFHKQNKVNTVIYKRNIIPITWTITFIVFTLQSKLKFIKNTYQFANVYNQEIWINKIIKLTSKVSHSVT